MKSNASVIFTIEPTDGLNIWIDSTRSNFSGPATCTVIFKGVTKARDGNIYYTATTVKNMTYTNTFDIIDPMPYLSGYTPETTYLFTDQI